MSFLTSSLRKAVAGTELRAAMAARHSVAPRVSMQQVRNYAAHHEDESFEAFNARYTSFFEAVDDVFELQRGLNNCFSYDLVPSPEVVEAALRASRRVNDLSTAVRVFEGIKEKVENQGQYQKYVEALKPLRDELGITLKEELYSS